MVDVLINFKCMTFSCKIDGKRYSVTKMLSLFYKYGHSRKFNGPFVFDRKTERTVNAVVVTLNYLAAR